MSEPIQFALEHLGQLLSESCEGCCMFLEQRRHPQMCMHDPPKPDKVSRLQHADWQHKQHLSIVITLLAEAHQLDYHIHGVEHHSHDSCNQEKLQGWFNFVSYDDHCLSKLPFDIAGILFECLWCALLLLCIFVQHGYEVLGLGHFCVDVKTNQSSYQMHAMEEVIPHRTRRSEEKTSQDEE